jgi:hypothetical protein
LRPEFAFGTPEAPETHVDDLHSLRKRRLQPVAIDEMLLRHGQRPARAPGSASAAVGSSSFFLRSENIAITPAVVSARS